MAVSGSPCSATVGIIRDVAGSGGTVWRRVGSIVKASRYGKILPSGFVSSLGTVGTEAEVIDGRMRKIKVNQSINVLDIYIAFVFGSKLIYVICLRRK